ncbi:MAG: DUF421 domain-containing protein [Firmicutes bacterium]|nr:DUF421 domain-containing protein [Bacillota bacterium]
MIGAIDFDLNWIWKAMAIVIVGSLLLRFAGRKSISQLTVAQTVIMIAVGALLIQPVSGASIGVAFFLGLVIVLTLIMIEYAELQFNFLEQIFTGKAVVIIENGAIREDNLKALRLTVDKLEVRLRQLGISKVEDVHWATLEPNGQLGYQLKPHAMPARREDIQKLMKMLEAKLPEPPADELDMKPDENNIFDEILFGRGDAKPPKKLR